LEEETEELMLNTIRAKWRLLSVGAMLVVLLAGGATIFAINNHSAHASGSGGGYCIPNTGPSCTFKGATANVDVEQWDATGCEVTSAGIFATQNITHPTTAGGYQGPSASVHIYRYNYCTNDTSTAIDAWGFADNSNFTASGDLSSASVSGTAMLFDYYTNTTIPATFDVSWKGVGDLTKTIQSFHSRTLHTISHYHTTGDSRMGIATGNITIGGTNYLAVPGTGMLMNSQGGQVDITHL
jgi:hypothetical protein